MREGRRLHTPSGDTPRWTARDGKACPEPLPLGPHCPLQKGSRTLAALPLGPEHREGCGGVNTGGPTMPNVYCRSWSHWPLSPAACGPPNPEPGVGQPSGLQPHSPACRPSRAGRPSHPEGPLECPTRYLALMPGTCSTEDHVAALLVLPVVEGPELSQLVTIIGVPRTRAPICHITEAPQPPEHSSLKTGSQPTAAQQRVLETGLVLIVPLQRATRTLCPDPTAAPLHGLITLRCQDPSKRHPNIPTSFQQPPPPIMRRPCLALNPGQKEGQERGLCGGTGQ